MTESADYQLGLFLKFVLTAAVRGLAIFHRGGTSSRDPALTNFVRTLERYLVVISLAKSSGNVRDRLVNDVLTAFQESDSISKVSVVLNSRLEEYDSREQILSQVSDVLNGDILNLSGSIRCKYILLRVNDAMTKSTSVNFRVKAPELSVEHFVPQKIYSNSAWRKPPFNWTFDQASANVYRLGNLVILPKPANSKFTNKNFETKKSEFRQILADMPWPITLDLLTYDQFSYDDFTARHNRIFGNLQVIWSLPDLITKVEDNGPNQMPEQDSKPQKKRKETGAGESEIVLEDNRDLSALKKAKKTELASPKKRNRKPEHEEGTPKKSVEERALKEPCEERTKSKKSRDEEGALKVPCEKKKSLEKGQVETPDGCSIQ